MSSQVTRLCAGTIQPTWELTDGAWELRMRTQFVFRLYINPLYMYPYPLSCQILNSFDLRGSPTFCPSKGNVLQHSMAAIHVWNTLLLIYHWLSVFVFGQPDIFDLKWQCRSQSKGSRAVNVTFHWTTFKLLYSYAQSSKGSKENGPQFATSRPWGKSFSPGRPPILLI